jgi:hypothetical protein
MPDTRISDLPAATALAAADLAAIVQGSGAAAETRRASFAQITAGIFAERMFHVRDYGAIGNGTADDVAAIQAAIDAAAAAGGGIVRLGPRRYRIGATELVVKENVCLKARCSRAASGLPPTTAAFPAPSCSIPPARSACCAARRCAASR